MLIVVRVHLNIQIWTSYFKHIQSKASKTPILKVKVKKRILGRGLCAILREEPLPSQTHHYKLRASALQNGRPPVGKRLVISTGCANKKQSLRKKIHYLTYCKRFFHQIYSFHRGGLAPHKQQISSQYLLWFKKVIGKKVHGNNVHGKKRPRKNGPRKIGPLRKNGHGKKVHPIMKKAEKTSTSGRKNRPYIS